MQPEIKKYLYDITQAGNLILSFVKDKSFADYERDPMLRSAVERQFEIIGEALNSIQKLDPSIKDRITDIRKIINFRNVLIHGYAIISHDVVWGVIESSLPLLLHQVSIASGEGDSPPTSL